MKMPKLVLASLSLVATVFLINQNPALAAGHLITVSSTAFPTTKCFLDPIQNGDSVTGLVYVFGSAPVKNFSVDALKTATTIYSQDFQKVVQIQVDDNFDERSGGKVQMIMLHEFYAFGSNDYRTIHLQVKNENGGWVAYIDENAGLVSMLWLSWRGNTALIR